MLKFAFKGHYTGSEPRLPLPVAAPEAATAHQFGGRAGALQPTYNGMVQRP